MIINSLPNENINNSKIDNMAIIIFSLLQKLKGKIGNLIFYQARGQNRMRSQNQIKRVPKTATQILQQNRIRASVSFYRANQNDGLSHIWRQEAKDKVMSGYNLFLSKNLAAFDQEHRIRDYGMLHISCGKLELPAHLQVTSYESGYIHLNWDNIIPEDSARNQDFLHAKWMNAKGNFSLQKVTIKNIRRKDKEAHLAVPEAGKEEIHLYLYFSDEEGDQFSPDKYFHLQKR